MRCKTTFLTRDEVHEYHLNFEVSINEVLRTLLQELRFFLLAVLMVQNVVCTVVRPAVLQETLIHTRNQNQQLNGPLHLSQGNRNYIL